MNKLFLYLYLIFLKELVAFLENSVSVSILKTLHNVLSQSSRSGYAVLSKHTLKRAHFPLYFWAFN